MSEILSRSAVLQDYLRMDWVCNLIPMIDPSCDLLSWLQNAALFVCPMVIYILLFKGRHKHKNVQSVYSIPYWNFFLKKWWVRWSLWRLQSCNRPTSVSSVTAFMPSQEDEDLEAPKSLTRGIEVDSLAISGTDREGNAIHLKVSRKQNSVNEIWFYAQLENSTIFLLPEHPDCTFVNCNNKNSWRGGGLKLQVCEPLRKWRISFNGLLRQRVAGKENTIDIKHVRFSFIWTTCSDVVDIQSNWSPALKCDAIAREPWKNATWLEMSKELGEGYDQWGVLHGTWRVLDDNSGVKELYLRGIRQRRYGMDESDWLRRSLNYVGVSADGTMFSIEGRCSDKPGLTHAIFGHIYKPDGCQAALTDCNLSLPNVGEYPESIPKHAVLRFKAASKNYVAVIYLVPQSAVTVYGGQPWNYETRHFVFCCSLNGIMGSGTSSFRYRYSGAGPAIYSSSVPLLKEPQLKYEAKIPLVVSFKDRQCGSSALVGGKGSSLGLMANVGHERINAEIPNGFCLTVEALEVQMHEFEQLQQAVTTLELVSSTSSELGDVQEQCNRTVALFESTPVCEAVSLEVLRYLQLLMQDSSKCQLLAVRSSAVGEDSEELSAAGQNATLLGVQPQLKNILEAIQECWASLYTFQSLQYRRQHGQAVHVGMGVVIQLMVPADSAGVLFTWHPTSGDPRQILITANFGLGESVVSAQVEPDTIVLERDRMDRIEVKESRCGRKAHRVSLSEAGGITAELLDRENMSKLSLTTLEAIALGNLGIQLEKMFGSPRDIEWAISEGKIYLLQARPITSLDSWSDFELLHEFDAPIITEREVLTTANVGEVFPGAITPLSQSTTTRSADLATRHGLPFRPGYHYSTSVITTSHHGMINVLNTMLRSVGSEISLADKVVDLAVYGHLVTNMELLKRAIERNGVVNSVGKIMIVLKILKDMLIKGRVVKKAKKLTSEFVLHYQTHSNALSLYLCISNGLSTLAKVAECHGHTSRVGLFTQVVAITVLAEGNEELTPDHYSDMGLLLSSCSDVVSAEIPAALEDLAVSIKDSGRAAAFCKIPPSQAIQWLSENCPTVFIKLTSFLKKHGHRSIKEFELMTETWGMKPEGLMRTLQTMLKNSPDEIRKAKKKTFSDTELLSQLKSVKKSSTRKALGWLLSMCRNTVAGREINKDCYITVTHRLRLAYRHLAHLMVKEGRIPDPQLLFFFTHYELGVLLRTRDPVLLTKAQRRRRLHPQWNRLTFSEITRGIPAPLSAKSQLVSNHPGSRMKGTSVCPGTVMGRACVVTDLEDIGKLQPGDILITQSTDVGWSPYFPLLGGVVTELGGLISHGAVVAREYGLPCIIGCQGATRIFNTGDIVLLVGAMGTIEKIDENKEPV